MSELAEKIKAWRSEFGMVFETKLGGKPVVLRVPDQADFEDVQDRVSTNKPSAVANARAPTSPAAFT